MASPGGGAWQNLTPPTPVVTAGQSGFRGSTTLDPDKHSSTASTFCVKCKCRLLHCLDRCIKGTSSSCNGAILNLPGPRGEQGGGRKAPRYAFVHSDVTVEALAVMVDAETVVNVNENCSTEGATPEATSSGGLARTDLALDDRERLGRAESSQAKDAGVAVASIATLAMNRPCLARDVKSASG